MTSKPHVIAPTAELATARAVMHDHKIHHLPVVEHEQLVGILSDRDLARISDADDRVRDAMTTDVATLRKDAPLDEAVALMRLERFGSVVVVGAGGVEGIFTTTDALRALYETLHHAEVVRL